MPVFQANQRSVLLTAVNVMDDDLIADRINLVIEATAPDAATVVRVDGVWREGKVDGGKRPPALLDIWMQKPGVSIGVETCPPYWSGPLGPDRDHAAVLTGDRSC